MLKCCFDLLTTNHLPVPAGMETFNRLLVTCHATSFDVLFAIHDTYDCLQPAEILINSLKIED